MNTIKIAFLAPEFLPTWGGVGIYSVELIRELSKYPDLEIHVITPRRGDDYRKRNILDYFGDRIFLHNLSIAKDTFFYNFKFQLALFMKFAELHKKYHYDLIHSANLVHMPDILMKFRNFDIPSLCTIHTTINGQVKGFLRSNKNFFRMAPSEKMSLILYPLIALLEKVYIRKTDHFITVSKKFSESLEKSIKKPVIPIPNGINKARFDFNIDPYKKYPQFKGKKVILFAGRIITQKGIQHFVHLMKHIDAHFVIAGRGDKNLLFDLIKRYDIPKKRYTYMGFVDHKDLPSLYRLSDIFILPSYYENFPISLLEAMAMKCTCIATDVGAVDEIIEDGKDGYIVPADDFDSLLERTAELIEDKKKRERFSRLGFRKVMDSLTSEMMAKKTYGLYMKILSEKAVGFKG